MRKRYEKTEAFVRRVLADHYGMPDDVLEDALDELRDQYIARNRLEAVVGELMKVYARQPGPLPDDLEVKIAEASKIAADILPAVHAKLPGISLSEVIWTVINIINEDDADA
jgi:hypothetical protein